MKKIFIGGIYRKFPEEEILERELKKIDEKVISICYSNQFINIAKKIKEKKLLNVNLLKQVLGCSNPKFPEDTEAILVIGQGTFHSVSLAYESGLPTYILEGNLIRKIKKEEIEKMIKKERGAMLKYLTSSKVGVLITNKPGQQRISKAINFKKNLNEKKAYLFLDNHIDVNQFENFGLDCWVNTSCPRMDLVDIKGLINLDKIKN